MRMTTRKKPGNKKGARPSVFTSKIGDHRRIVETALESVEDVFSDTRVPLETTLESLEEIQAGIETKMDAVRGDIKARDNRSLGASTAKRDCTLGGE